MKVKKKHYLTLWRHPIRWFKVWCEIHKACKGIYGDWNMIRLSPAGHLTFGCESAKNNFEIAMRFEKIYSGEEENNGEAE